MTILSYNFINNRTTKKFIFIEENGITEIRYKVIYDWKSDYDITSYSDSIKVALAYFTDELLKISPMLYEAYNISKKLTLNDNGKIKNKVVHYYITEDFHSKTEYTVETLNNKNLKNKNNKAVETDSDIINTFVSNFEYGYKDRHEGMPKLEEIDDIKEMS